MNRIEYNRFKDKGFKLFAIVTTFSGLALLAIFIGDILIEGVPRLNWQFLTGLTSGRPERAGILPALVGSLWILGFTALFAFPLGVSAAIYLEEYAPKNRFTNIIETNISNLAGVPSIIYGLLGLEVFARMMRLGSSVLAGSLTLALLILPIIIVATRESLKAVPNSIREASFAMGASRWQTVWHQLLPASFGGTLTGVILALSRAVGETAPLIVVGAMALAPVPTNPMQEYSVLPLQIFNWISRPQHGFLVNAAAAIIILLIITFLMNGIAVYLRNRWQKKIKW